MLLLPSFPRRRESYFRSNNGGLNLHSFNSTEIPACAGMTAVVGRLFAGFQTAFLLFRRPVYFQAALSF
ncbi:hypothetical protein HMPREF9120_02502 [Neisseria sp. oral taxon 020 str. F0370]|nr:hypothetical protein HMPREF9120_02502 [Neisseria sp. oral taxon 020 str. F0370]